MPRGQWFIVPLAHRQSFSTSLVGGKAAQLAELVNLGLPVPRAMCITTAAYRTYLRENDLEAWLQQVLQTVVPGDYAGIVATSRDIRERFAASPVPSAIADEIVDGYHEIHRVDSVEPGPVAVRSSATSEDSRAASFAGQCETKLNVRGEEAVVSAVVGCWGSIHSERALLYRARHGLLGPECAAGVVQRLVPADRGAVVFSANPVDGDQSSVVIDATWGLGEAIVSGRVTPDHYVVSKSDLGIRTRKIGRKEVMTAALPEGGTADLPVPVELRLAPALEDEQAVELARLAISLEQVRRHPVDLECAYHGPKLAVLQCRPVTTL